MARAARFCADRRGPRARAPQSRRPAWKRGQGKARHNTQARNIPARNALRIGTARWLNHRAVQRDRWDPKEYRAEASLVAESSRGGTPLRRPRRKLGSRPRRRSRPRERPRSRGPTRFGAPKGILLAWFAYAPPMRREWRLQVVAPPVRPVHEAGKKAPSAEVRRHKVLLVWMFCGRKAL